MRVRTICAAASLVAVVGGAFAASASAGGYAFTFTNFGTADGFQSRHGFSCVDDNAVAVAGGALGNGTYADGTYVSESTPGVPAGPKQGWTGQIDNYPGGSPTNTAYVTLTCAKDAKHDYDRKVENNGVSVPDDHLGGATLKCGDNQTVVGGGNDTSLNAGFEDETYLSMSAPVDGNDGDKLPDDGWRVEINNDEDAGQLTTKSDLYAICDKKRGPSAYHYVTKKINVADGFQATAKAKCPKDEKAISGGVESLAPYEASLLVNGTYRAETANTTEWIATVDNYDTPDNKTRKIAATAICKR